MPYAAYNVLHFLGIFLLLVALATMLGDAAAGADKATSRTRKLALAFHGLGLLIILVSGFGLLARLGLVAGIPGWAWAKVLVWVVFGGLVALPYRKPELAKPLLWAVPLLALLNAYLAIYKPF